VKSGESIFEDLTEVYFMINPKWLLFDIGGVLAEFTGIPKMLEWTGWKYSRDEMVKMWLYSKAVRTFESGKSTPADFSDAMIREFELSIEPEVFMSEFTNFINGLYPGAMEFLQDLSAKYSVAILSNTNEIHWAKLDKAYDLENLIQNRFLSFRTGLLKPDQETFLKVIQDLNCDAAKIIFFDDSRANVEAAKEAGMHAVRVAGFDDLRNQLIKMGI
jgi:HAD superfamily hydrolase (TIGR01509 family)